MRTRLETLRKALTERGASAVEYGLMVAGIAALIAIIVFALGGPTLGMYDNACQKWVAEQGSGTCS